jgi:hypothetical protein
MKNKVYIIEHKRPRANGAWLPTDLIEFTYKNARTLLDEIACPDEKYRIRKYVSEE